MDRKENRTMRMKVMILWWSHQTMTFLFFQFVILPVSKMHAAVQIGLLTVGTCWGTDWIINSGEFYYATPREIYFSQMILAL